MDVGPALIIALSITQSPLAVAVIVLQLQLILLEILSRCLSNTAQMMGSLEREKVQPKHKIEDK